VSAPDPALHDLAALLAGEDSVVTPHVADPGAEAPLLGMLVAAGQRTAPAPSEYALIVETVREGYLLHYARDDARVVRDTDSDLALLAGDYLYALGLERLAVLADLEAVHELSELISLAAQVHDGSRDPERTRREAAALWLACATAIAGGGGAAHDRAKDDVRAESYDAAASLWTAALETAESGGFRQALGDAAAGLDFRADHLPSLG
jgi:hypothetical protein